MDCSAVNLSRFCWDCIYPRFSRERWILKETIMGTIIAVIIAISIPTLMVIAWLMHIAICWHWDFKEWYHSSDDDI